MGLAASPVPRHGNSYLDNPLKKEVGRGSLPAVFSRDQSCEEPDDLLGGCRVDHLRKHEAEFPLIHQNIQKKSIPNISYLILLLLKNIYQKITVTR